MLIKYEKQNKFKPVSEGFHQAVCKSVYNLGLQEINYQTERKIEHRVVIVWEVDERITDEGEYKGKRYNLSREYKVSLHEKSNLRKDLISWRGRDFTDDELQGFELNSIIGANCWLEVTHDGDYAKVKSVKNFKPLMVGQTLPEPMIIKDTTGNIPKRIKAKIDKQLPPEQSQAVASNTTDDDIAPF